VLIGGAVIWGIDFSNKNIRKDIDELQEKRSQIQKEIDKAKGENEGDVDSIILSISKNNKDGVSYFNAISREIPSNIWLTYYYSDVNGSVSIKGDTANVESLYGFFNGIKNSAENKEISLSKLEYNDIDALLDSSGGGNKTLKFEISKGSNVEEPAVENSEESETDSKDKNAKTTNKKKKSDSSSDKKTDSKSNSKPISTDDDVPNDEGLPEPPAFEPPAAD
ncbi:hypothetical protein IJS77_04845, partial [bacterium]|nr:hypothetical protein [bacterium]